MNVAHTGAFARIALASSAALSALAIAASATAATFILPGSLLVSSTTYADIGNVAALISGTSNLAGKTAGTTVKAVSDGSFATVFNNDGVDGSFGVTSAIRIQDLNASSAAVNGTVNIDPNLVSTSFSSKSELGLSITQTAKGPVATFMGYAGGGVGNLDVSNSDTTAYQDSTNPVTATFGSSLGGNPPSYPLPGNPNYAFNRAVVALGADGTYSDTQTLAYGGNNGRAAVLGANGLYYTVGNSNNGSGTPSQLTTSTGLEVVTPGGGANSTMIDPAYQSIVGDKAGKDNNFRGLTLYNGALYFTKGSGGNGIDTVYTVSNPNNQLPTAATAGQAIVSILPGFPTDHAKAGGDYTPFGLFFANQTTLYVADEGGGDTTDAALHAGLEKWSLIAGSWQLDYTLQSGLIGTSYTVSGTNSGQVGAWPTVTTIGLRNLTGRVNADGTVTLYATTSTISASGDNGADPNEVVDITDLLSATTSAGESFSVFDGPQYGVRYGGVAFDTAVPEPATWALVLVGFGVLGGALRDRRTVAKA